MLKTETKQILFEFDEIGSYETPSDFDYDKLVFEIEKFKTELETIFGIKFNIDYQIQDASFVCDIIISEKLLIKNSSEYRHSIRFSNFGKLVTVNGIDNLNLKSLQIIQRELKNYNFIFLEPDEIDVEYDGKFENFKTIYSGNTPSWFVRYFDYL
ncbi:MAG: hypothetical protein ABNG98_07870 [Flavobacterium sp.]|jgi:hypothetical protein